MELWEKHCAYIPRRFVVIEVISSPASITVLAQSSSPEVLPSGPTPNDGRHREPRDSRVPNTRQSNKFHLSKD
jgi:hypothetical protein